MENIKGFKIDQVPVWKIILAATSDPDYEMDRTLLVDGYPNWGDYLIVSGGHCSCYDFDETEWDATSYTEAELKKLVMSWMERGYGSERIIAPLIARYLKEQ